jgi:hypothetical protein
MNEAYGYIALLGEIAKDKKKGVASKKFRDGLKR